MTNKQKININKFISRHWVITLTSTMLGVILGLFLQDYYQNRSLKKAKKIALEQVTQEINKNHDDLVAYQENLETKFEGINYLLSNINSENEIVIHKDSLGTFKTKSNNVFDYSNYETVSKDAIKISGDLNLNVSSPLVLIGLSDINWNSYKQTNYLSITNFRCLTDIEGVYKLQEEVNTLNSKWWKEFMKAKFLDMKWRNEFMSDWENLLLKQKLLLDIYSYKDRILETCE